MKISVEFPFRKAAKALLVLIPLLGVTYILVIWKPAQKEARAIFTYLQVALLPTQVNNPLYEEISVDVFVPGGVTFFK